MYTFLCKKVVKFHHKQEKTGEGLREGDICDNDNNKFF